MERPRDPLDLVIGLREEMAELRVTVAHLSGDVGDLKQDFRRLDDRFFKLMLLQFATLAGVLGSIVAALAS